MTEFFFFKCSDYMLFIDTLDSKVQIVQKQKDGKKYIMQIAT